MTLADDPTGVPQVSRVKQVAAYEVGTKETDQVISLQNSLVSVANLFLVTTGALWVAVTSDTLKLPEYASAIVLLFHLIGSVATLQFIAANLNGMKLRFIFLREFGDQYYPEIQRIGDASYVETYDGKSRLRAEFTQKYARWGNPPVLLWYLIPIAGFIGSFYLLIQVASGIM